MRNQPFQTYNEKKRDDNFDPQLRASQTLKDKQQANDLSLDYDQSNLVTLNSVRSNNKKFKTISHNEDNH